MKFSVSKKLHFKNFMFVVSDIISSYITCVICNGHITLEKTVSCDRIGLFAVCRKLFDIDQLAANVIPPDGFKFCMQVYDNNSTKKKLITAVK